MFLQSLKNSLHEVRKLFIILVRDIVKTSDHIFEIRCWIFELISKLEKWWLKRSAFRQFLVLLKWLIEFAIKKGWVDLRWGWKFFILWLQFLFRSILSSLVDVYVILVVNFDVRKLCFLSFLSHWSWPSILVVYCDEVSLNHHRSVVSFLEHTQVGELAGTSV